jgi:hypothetical protein
MRGPVATAWIVAAAAGVGGDAAGLEKRASTWSELTGGRIHRAKAYRESAVIVSVDGIDHDARLVKVAPGKRKVVVRSPYRAISGNVDRPLELDVAPCRRYYINAQFADAVTPGWEPVIARVEVISGCSTPLKPPPGR